MSRDGIVVAPKPDIPVLPERPPSFAIRCTTFFGCATPLFCIFALLDYLEPIPLNPAMLAAVSTVAVVLVMSSWVQVLRLRKKRRSAAASVFALVVGAAGVVALLELKRRGIFVWNELYVTVPVLLCSILVFAACYVAESRHSVRVYLALDGFHYVRP